MRSAPAIQAECGPARSLVVWLIGLHALVLSQLALVSWGAGWRTGLGALVVLSAICLLRRHGLLLGAGSVRRFAWSGSGRWLLTDSDGKSVEARLETAVSLGRAFIMMNWRDSGGLRRTAVLTPENSRECLRRRLAVRLRWDWRGRWGKRGSQSCKITRTFGRGAGL